jgi:hypothetical protein
MSLTKLNNAATVIHKFFSFFRLILSSVSFDLYCWNSIVNEEVRNREIERGRERERRRAKRKVYWYSMTVKYGGILKLPLILSAMSAYRINLPMLIVE